MNGTATASTDFTEHAAEIVSAYVAHNSIPVAELPNLLRSIHEALAGLCQPAPAEVPRAPPVPAVPIKKSVTDEYIVSLEDGRKFKSLKRYLATSHNMTSAEYRAKWGLPPDYPMMAPAYAKARSALAKGMNFGRKAAQPMLAPAAEEVSQPEPEAAAPAPKRGRAKKAA